jgi:integrase
MTRRTPSYCLHKASGQAVVRIDGKDHYLGRYGSPESKAEYDRLIGEWLLGGRQTPRRDEPPSLSVSQLLLRYWQFAEQHYRDPQDGTPSRELDNLKDALRPLRKLYGHTPACDFGPLALRAVREAMIRAGLCRNVINCRVNRIRRVFKWAVSVELLPAAVLQALRSVEGLRRGRGGVRETEKVKPVAEEHVLAVFPHLPGPVRAMVELQWLTSCRAGEIRVMRGMDLDVSKPVWVYRPGSHKNAHRGQDRLIFLGPRAQQVVKEFLKPDLQAYLFCPRDLVEATRRQRALARTTKRTPSELARQRKARSSRKAGLRYSRRSYRQAIVRACRKAGVPVWSPLQLRHAAATRIRAQYGVEMARVILGHTKVETSQIYAEADWGKAERVMAEIG